MSKEIDEKVVSMQFDNRQFEKNVQTTMSTLDKFKKKLNLDGAAKGLESVNTAAKNCDISHIGNAVESIRAKFSALQVMGITALSNITNTAINAGKRIASALTIEPVKMGFQEYETQINAVQTILANTQSKGTTLNDVNKALDELNLYADKTIYNFTEMTRNIGTFTAAGVDLKTSVSAIKGIANLAAVSGSTSQQASTAMYQLSQALASGTVKLMDWNSVVNAGMGGQVFQDALKETARVHGVNIDAMIKKEGSFRETLQHGWLTSSILTETLSKFTGDLNAQQLKSMGYTDKQIQEILKLGKTANDAATKVKTFTQLIDTLKEAAQSGWTQSWEIVIGDFEEAKSLLTEVSDTFSNLLNSSSNARNELLQTWKDLGGRTALIQSFKNAFEGVISIIKPVKEAFREVFPPITAKNLLTFTEKIRDLTAKLKINEETASKLKRIFKGVFSVLDLGKKAITAILKPLFDFSQSKGIGSLSDTILEIAASIGDFFTSINEGTKANSFFSSFSNSLTNVFKKVSNVLKSATDGVKGFGDTFKSVLNRAKDIATKIGSNISKAFKWITENVSMKDVFAGLAGGGIFMALKKFSDLMDKLKEIFSDGILKGLFGKKDEEGIGDKFKSILDQVHDSLKSFTNGLKISSLVSIAIAIGILSASLSSISKLKGEDIAKSLSAMATMFIMLSLSFKSLTKSLSKYESKDVTKAGIAMIGMSISIKILASALKDISGLSIGDISKGLLGIGIGLLEFVGILKLIEKSKVTSSTKTLFSLISIAITCKVLASALSDFSSMSWSEISRGLTAMGGALLEISAVFAIINKISGKGSLTGAISILIITLSLNKIYDSLKNFGSMSWSEIARGLVGMGVALAELGAVVGILGKFVGSSGLLGAATILLVSLSLKPIADALTDISVLSWDEIAKGLVGMGVALVELGVVVGVLGKFVGASGLLGAATILLVSLSLKPIADALTDIGSLSWSEIARGLVGMGVALVELGVVTGLLGTFAPTAILGAATILLVSLSLKPIADALTDIGSLSWSEIARGLVGMGVALVELGVVTGLLGTFAPTAILGSLAILVVVQGLGDLADALKKFGSMSWSEIARGLVGMGGALTELSVITGLLGNLGGLGALVGAGSILLAVQGLGDLADSLKKFGEMSWEEIGRGLTAMGAAMSEVALGSVLNTLSGLGAASISEVASSLGILADSLKKWTGITVPENLGEQLGSLASAVMKFTFGGSGAGAISEVAAPLGIMADSVKKWSGVVVPENIGSQIGTLADGVKKFTFGGIGAGALSEAAAPLGTMADSVKKWSGVTIPENMGTQLSQLADGVESFSFAFAGGWSISAVNEPLGDLADTITKWSGVSIPKTMGTQLSGLADGIESFSFTFMGGWSIGDIVEPLGNLAGAVSKWSGVIVPESISSGLKDIADGISEFGLLDSTKLKGIAEPLNTVGTAFKNLSYINSTGVNLITFSKNVKACADELYGINKDSINVASDSVNTLVGIINKVNGTNTDKIGSFVTAANKLNEISISNININSSNLSTAISEIKKTMDSIAKTINSSKSSINSATQNAVSGMSDAVKSKSNAMSIAGKDLMSTLEKAINDKKPSIISACKKLVSESADGIKAFKASFKTSGGYLGDGLIEGIKTKYNAAYKAGYELGKRAVQGEKDGQKSASPSKLTIQSGKWLGEGLIIGIKKMGNAVYNAGYNMGDRATTSITKAVSTIASAINTDIDVQPTIRPVLDLSDINSGASSIDNMIGKSRTLAINTQGVNSIATSMNKIQNGTNNDNVVSAIKSLRKDLANSPRNMYNINGITYDDGTNVANAIQTLVRATRIERRA